MNLYNYQNRAMSSFIDFVNQDTKGCMLLSAPTGSGKTVIAGSALNQLSTLTNAFYIWLTPGKGNLTTQSLNALSLSFDKLNLVLLTQDSSDKLKLSDVHENTIVVANWEYLWSSKSNSLPNYKQAIDGQCSLLEMVDFAKKSGVKVVVIVDESHNISSGEISGEMIKELNPDYRIDITATPKNKEYLKTEIIGYEEVATSGAIKPSVLVNYQLNASAYHGDDAINVIYLRSALDRLIKIEQVAKSEDIRFNPLLLIQIENSDAKKSDVRNIELINNILDEYAINKHEVAIWAEGAPSTLEGVTLKNQDVLNDLSEIRVLVFKQAIALGWDCPRASILMQFRKTTDESFQLQLVGRILRMPKQLRHQSNAPAELKTAYIYSAFNADKAITPSLDLSMVSETLALSTRSNKYAELNLTKESIETIDDDIDTTNELTAIAEVRNALDLNGVIWQEPTFQESVLSDAVIDLVNNSNNQASTSKLYIIDDNAIYDRLVSRIESDFRDFHRGWIKEILVPAISDACPISSISMADVALQTYKHAKIYETYNQLHGKLQQLSIDGVCVYRPQQKRFISASWEAPALLMVPDTYKTKSGYLYDLAPDESRLSKPELAFIAALTDRKLQTINSYGFKMLWWWKNGDSGADYFSIGYTAPDGEKHLFYPDFLIYGEVEINGIQQPKLFIIETKDATQFDGSPTLEEVNAQKHSALKNWGAKYQTSKLIVDTAWVCVDVKANLAQSLFKNYQGNPF